MLVEINLLGEKERDRPAFVVAAIALILLGVIAGIVFYSLGNSYEKRQQELVAQSAGIISQQAEIQSQLQTSATLNDTQKLQKTVEWAEAYQFDTLPLIRELTRLLPERGFFMSFSFTAPNQVAITVQFDTSRDSAFYLTQLKSSDMITDVDLSSLAYQPIGEEVTTEGTTIEDDSAEEIMPRYVASYNVTFLDTRMPADGTAVPVDPAAPPVEGETPSEGEATEDQPVTEEQPTESPVTEEQPVETPETEQTPPVDTEQGDDANE